MLRESEAQSSRTPRGRKRPPTETHIHILYFPPGAPPELRTIENTVDAMWELLGGRVDSFVSGVKGTILMANSDCNNPFSLNHICPVRNRKISARTAFIYGPFFISGDASFPRDGDAHFRSLCPLELTAVFERIAPELSQDERDAYLVQLEDAEARTKANPNPSPNPFSSPTP